MLGLIGVWATIPGLNPSLHFIAVINTTKETWRGKDLFQLIEKGTETEAMEKYNLLTCSVCFLIQPKPHLPIQVGTTPSGLGPPISVTNQENACWFVYRPA